MTGADPDVTARLAKSLLGHPGRKARFLQGPLQDWFGDRNLELFPSGIEIHGIYLGNGWGPTLEIPEKDALGLRIATHSSGERYRNWNSNSGG